MNIINGKEIAQGIISDLKKLPKPTKRLAAILVGNNPASISFLKQKEKIAAELGVEFQLYQLPNNIEQEDLESKIERVSANENIGGMIVQLPLPPELNRERALARINPAKDPDNLTGKAPVLHPAVEAVKDVLDEARYAISDKRVAVVGRGILVGKPVAEWLKGKSKEVKVFFSASDMSELKSYDLVITGVGKAGLIKPEMLGAGTVVIDFGFDMKNGKISGDLDTSSLSSLPSLSFYTPTPGGTGPILVAELFRNFYRLFK